MAKELVPETLQDQIEHLFPEDEPSLDGGRSRTDARTVLATILFVLKTGTGWKDLPTEAFGVSYKTCRW